MAFSLLPDFPTHFELFPLHASACATAPRFDCSAAHFTKVQMLSSPSSDHTPAYWLEPTRRSLSNAAIQHLTNPALHRWLFLL